VWQQENMDSQAGICYTGFFEEVDLLQYIWKKKKGNTNLLPG
jgi:hypothetical protein